MRSLPLLAIWTAFSAVPVAAFAEPPVRFDAAWGYLYRIGEGDTMRYTGFRQSEPAEGGLAVPEGFPPIVACTTFDRTGKTDADLPLLFDAQTGAAAIGSSDSPDAPAEMFEAFVAESVTQNPDGLIAFPANAAVVVGPGTAKLESNGSHHRIGFWTDPADSVAWVYDPTRWGRYRVLLTYSTESPDGGVATIEIGNEKIDVELPSTGSWYRYRTIEAGHLYVATDEKQKLIVRPKKLVGTALMNLKAVLLFPAFESDERAAQAADGTVTLHARDARVQGTKLRYEPKPEKNTLGYWTEERDVAHWSFDLQKPGTFDLEVWLGCGEGQGGSTMWAIGDDEPKVTTFKVESTGHFQNFVPRIVGRIRYSEAGRQHLSVKALVIAKAAACDIRQIRLIPVAEDAAEPTAPATP